MKGIVLIITCLAIVQTLDNGLAKTPAMGWNTWNKFACKINETLIMKTADIMVK